MDKISKNIVLDMLKSGNCIDMVSFELGIPITDIQRAMREIEQASISNILAEQLASRLPTLLELAIKQLESIILNENVDRRLRAINTVVQAATALSKLKP
ncbi:MAG: hypothetical protein PHR16_17530 [Methylovulum sp.]|nr:hypothetical protein [Methylovulum sp.]